MPGKRLWYSESFTHDEIEHRISIYDVPERNVLEVYDGEVLIRTTDSYCRDFDIQDLTAVFENTKKSICSPNVSW